MATTTIPACKAAILAIMAADSDFANVDLRWAPPTEGEDAPASGEAFYLIDTEIVDDNWASLGRVQGAGRRREEYRVAMSVWVAQFGDDPQAVELRVWELWSQVATNLRTDLFTQGASQLRAAGVQTMGQVTAQAGPGVFSPSQWGARVDARVTFKATTV